MHGLPLLCRHVTHSVALVGVCALRPMRHELLRRKPVKKMTQRKRPSLGWPFYFV